MSGDEEEGQETGSPYSREELDSGCVWIGNEHVVECVRKDIIHDNRRKRVMNKQPSITPTFASNIVLLVIRTDWTHQKPENEVVVHCFGIAAHLDVVVTCMRLALT